ncbi:MAG: HD domain-containing protein [Sphaerochaetaceae bacterium]|nr:HD domain-containing protein [Sphaerochaetaceae bacterium]
MERTDRLLENMIAYYEEDPGRIQHFLKVRAFADIIGKAEALSPNLLEILDVAAIVHDIGIKVAEQKFGDCNGKLQEQEGPALANAMLTSVGYGQTLIDRVCYLVGHHHTYKDIEGLDYQILVEADFLVNIYEGNYTKDAIQAVYDRIFKTERGRWLCRQLYGIID